MRLGIVVPTKDRLAEVETLLQSLANQTHAPSAVIVVDSSTPSIVGCVAVPERLPAEVMSFSPPSAARQRNAGIDAVAHKVDLVAFIDDDVVLDEDAIEAMLRFWEDAPDDVLGASFNIIDVSPTPGSRWKRSWSATALGIYDRRSGGVARSGWQTSFTTVEQDLEVRWLPSGAVCWRSEVLERDRFDPFFEGYSYLEDLEHSYRIGRRGRLFVVADARCEHREALHGRPAGFAFGRMEAVNRAFIVRRHRLSLGRYSIGMCLRAAMTLAGGVWGWDASYFARFAGNVVGLGSVLGGGPLRHAGGPYGRGVQ